jgi:hypothetical protein
MENINVARQEAIKAVWEIKPEVTQKAKAIKHTVRSGEKVSQVEQGLGAPGETVSLYEGSIDLAPLWDVNDVALLRSYAAQAVLLDAGERFKAKVLKGEAAVNDQTAMNGCVSEVLATYASMQGITPAAGPGTGGTKAPGKLKAAEGKVAKMAELQARLKAATSKAEKLAILDEIEALDL